MLLTTALHSDEGDDLKGYEMVWIEHLVGDVHQPLHDVNRFTSIHPHGDQGGNLVLICETANCSENLHGFGMTCPARETICRRPSISETTSSRKMPVPDDTAINVENPSAWINDGFQKAQTFAYAAPVTTDSAGSTPHKLDTGLRRQRPRPDAIPAFHRRPQTGRDAEELHGVIVGAESRSSGGP